jgi:hypothetical protein
MVKPLREQKNQFTACNCKRFALILRYKNERWRLEHLPDNVDANKHRRFKSDDICHTKVDWETHQIFMKCRD